MTDKLKVLDLFAGIGGFSLGLERTGGFETVAFCEIEKFPQRVLAQHWPEVPIYDDVRELTAARLAADGIAPNVITGGFPCQDISVAGKQAGINEETRSGLWSECARLVGEIRPEYALFENVSNLLSGPSEKRGGWFSRILCDLAALGYDAEWHGISASCIGAPHYRDRAWILAYPKQVQRVCAIFDANHAEKEGRLAAAEWRQDGFRFEMGGARRSIPFGWMDKPNPVRVVDGISDWSHRLGACGNAVVPQIPELIGRAILEAEASRESEAA